MWAIMHPCVSCDKACFELRYYWLGDERGIANRADQTVLLAGLVWSGLALEMKT